MQRTRGFQRVESALVIAVAGLVGGSLGCEREASGASPERLTASSSSASDPARELAELEARVDTLRAREAAAHEAERADPPHQATAPTTLAPPVGGDGPTVTVGPAGARTAAVPFLGGFLVLRPDGALERVTSAAGADGLGSVIDRDVLFAPVLSSDGALAAWAAERSPGPGTSEVVLVVIDVHGGRRDAVVGLQSIGAVVFDTDGDRPIEARRLAFVGARNGGVAGLWTAQVGSGELGASARGLACLTNCELRAGALGASMDAFEPLPTAPPRFDGDALVYTTNGAERRLTLPSRAPR